ncbi:hypothetical protein AYJ54_11140 [Bradyrhizobium centrolobii]|uniref:DUF1127 domain-containing protein n=2 Tax=Bradyrhizobium centrolobii TaxID=1505087 RepID=A0A176YRC1_9BRAD|nr:hypothetical protein AYJ54_11140 [Bradyrhizobium centrolobii]
MQMDTRASASDVSTSNLQRHADADRGDGSSIERAANLIMDLWIHWCRERRIGQATRSLALLDDHTLRDLGIPNRSEIEFTVRFCLDC